MSGPRKEAIGLDGRLRSGRVKEVLSRLVKECGALRYQRSDNGPEFVARTLLEWIADQRIETALIDPGKPWQNGVDGSFNGKFRDKCLSVEWSRSRTEAKAVVEAGVVATTRFVRIRARLFDAR